MGESGAGKTTLMDVLAGRKTVGTIQGDIRVNGHPKHDASFKRVMGYVEQTDTHTPELTVEEAMAFSARMRLPRDVGSAQTRAYADEVMQLIELDTIRHNITGMPGVSGLTVEQRKRLSIGVELAGNPSLIFMVRAWGCQQFSNLLHRTSPPAASMHAAPASSCAASSAPHSCSAPSCAPSTSPGAVLLATAVMSWHPPQPPDLLRV